MLGILAAVIVGAAVYVAWTFRSEGELAKSGNQVGEKFSLKQELARQKPHMAKIEAGRRIAKQDSSFNGEAAAYQTVFSISKEEAAELATLQAAHR